MSEGLAVFMSEGVSSCSCLRGQQLFMSEGLVVVHV